MTLPMNIFKVMQRLPHRYPFLLIDRILEVEMPNKRLKALKNVTIWGLADAWRRIRRQAPQSQALLRT